MLSNARRRLLADFLAATRNEITVDEMFLALSRLQPDDVGYLPRVPHWVRWAQRRPSTTRWISRLARIAWILGGAALFFAHEWLKFSRLKPLNDAPQAPHAEGAVLGLSTRVSDIVDARHFPGFPRTWLTLPWAPQSHLPMEARELPLMTLVDTADIRRAFVDAMAATWIMSRRRRLSPWVLQSYTAFRWFLVRRATDRLSGTLVTTEHFDRWAILADRCIREQRRNTAHQYRFVVVQHGALGRLDRERGSSAFALVLPTRLREVDELHAYNEDEATAFRTFVIADTARARAMNLHFFKPGIELTGNLRSSRPRLLFVGHPLCEEFHVAVFNALRERLDFEAYYKPHPKAPISGSMANVGWTIIDNPQTFPRVDLLVSYPSTLVIEYEGSGIPASVHRLDVTNMELDAFLAQTQERIDAGKQGHQGEVDPASRPE